MDFETGEHHQQLEVNNLSLRDRAYIAGSAILASLAIAAPGTASADGVPEQTFTGDANPQVTRADTSGMTDQELEAYCVQDALYSFEGGYVRYARPDRNGRYLTVKQHVEAGSVDPTCNGVVTREIGVQQYMGRKQLTPNTDYGVVSESSGAVNRTISQKGFRAWKCFKQFQQRVFVTVNTSDGHGAQKEYKGVTTKPNC